MSTTKLWVLQNLDDMAMKGVVISYLEGVNVYKLWKIEPSGE